MLATEVQRTSGFIPIKIVARLYLVVNEKKPKTVHTTSNK